MSTRLRIATHLCLLSLCWTATTAFSAVTAQQSTSSSVSQPALTIQQVKAAFTSNAAVGKVTLDGTFISTEGSLQQEGNAHLVVSGDGTYSVSLSKTVGSTGEQRSVSDSLASCNWTDPKGNAHLAVSFNCQAPAWFLPELPLLLNSESNSEWTLASQTADSSGVHIKFSYAPPSTTNSNVSPVQAIDIALSTDTLLPSSATYFLHPDDQGYINVPIMVTYGNYQRVSGVSVPFHIQRYVNGTLTLDITLSSANVK